MRTFSTFLDQSFKLVIICAIIWHTPGYTCDIGRKARNAKEIKWQNAYIASESAELKRILERERPPLAAHVASTTLYIEGSTKRIARNKEMLAKLEAAMRAGREVFARLSENNSYRTQLGSSLEVIFRNHESVPGEFDRQISQLSPDLKTALAPLLQSTDVSSKTLIWTVGFLLLQACKSDDSHKILDGQETFTSMYEEFGRHFENQLLDDKKADELNKAAFKDAQEKLVALDAKIASIQAGIQRRQAIREAAESDNAKIICKPSSPRDYPT